MGVAVCLWVGGWVHLPLLLCVCIRLMLPSPQVVLGVAAGAPNDGNAKTDYDFRFDAGSHFREEKKGKASSGLRLHFYFLFSPFFGVGERVTGF